MTEREAILSSIEHWEDNLNILILNHLAGEGLSWDINTSSRACALCQLYLDFDIDSCVKCPVVKKTGLLICEGTPYFAVLDCLKESCTDYERFYNAIMDEIYFLYTLLE